MVQCPWRPDEHMEKVLELRLKLIVSSLKEQYILLTIEPSLCVTKYFLKTCLILDFIFNALMELQSICTVDMSTLKVWSTILSELYPC